MKKICTIIIVLVLLLTTAYAVTDSELAYQQEVLHKMADCARELGWGEDCEVIRIASFEWWRIRDERLALQEAEKQWEMKAAEYPNATRIWRFLIEELGYNNYVAAGIMGNVMVECGGFTLAIEPTLYSYGSGYYYGICQWNKSAYPEVRGQDLEYQLQYLATTIEYEINTYGYMYIRGHKYNDFIEMTNARDAALMFAKSYERCGSSTYALRQNCADTAYEYFVK